MGLEQVIDRCLRDKILPLVGEADRQFAGRQFGLLQRQVDDLAPDILGDTVPDTIWPGGTILQRLGSTDEVAIVPRIKRGPRDAEPLQRLADRQMRLLDQPDDHGSRATSSAANSNLKLWRAFRLAMMIASKAMIRLMFKE
jgi:hypothetical protein